MKRLQIELSLIGIKTEGARRFQSRGVRPFRYPREVSCFARAGVPCANESAIRPVLHSTRRWFPRVVRLTNLRHATRQISCQRRNTTLTLRLLSKGGSNGAGLLREPFPITVSWQAIVVSTGSSDGVARNKPGELLCIGRQDGVYLHGHTLNLKGRLPDWARSEDRNSQSWCVRASCFQLVDAA